MASQRLKDGIRLAACSLIPIGIVPALERAEHLLGQLQGKGVGTASLEAEVKAVLSRANDRLVVLDVGANAGEWSRAMLRRGGDRIERLIAFEPSIAHRESLARINDLRFSVERMAVGETEGQHSLFTNFPGSGIASLTRRRLDHYDATMDVVEQVQVTTLDAYAARHNIGRIDILKMDIEGHELTALRGAKRLLGTRSIPVILFEFGGTNIDTRVFFQDFWYLLAPLGYRFARVLYDGRTLPIPQYSEWLESPASTNYVAWIDG